jgi:surfeit locus 1 family protein
VSAATRRRPGELLLFGVFAIAAIGAFVALGTWQLERKAWKEALIATLDARLAARSSPLPTRARWAGLDAPADEFSRVVLRAEFLPGREGRVYAGGSGLRDDIKAPGYFVFAPARLADGGVVVVNRGYIANAHPDAALRPIALPEGPVEIVGVMRWPEPPGAFVAAHSEREDLWFVRDHLAMAAAYGWGAVAPFYIDQEAPVPAGGVPRPAPLKLNLRNEHLQYALTWFGLAGVLAVALVVWVRGRRREPSFSAHPRGGGDPGPHESRS